MSHNVTRTGRPAGSVGFWWCNDAPGPSVPVQPVLGKIIGFGQRKMQIWALFPAHSKIQILLGCCAFVTRTKAYVKTTTYQSSMQNSSSSVAPHIHCQIDSHTGSKECSGSTGPSRDGDHFGERCTHEGPATAGSSVRKKYFLNMWRLRSEVFPDPRCHMS